MITMSMSVDSNSRQHFHILIGKIYENSNKKFIPLGLEAGPVAWKSLALFYTTMFLCNRGGIYSFVYVYFFIFYLWFNIYIVKVPVMDIVTRMNTLMAIKAYWNLYCFTYTCISSRCSPVSQEESLLCNFVSDGNFVFTVNWACLKFREPKRGSGWLKGARRAYSSLDRCRKL